MAGITKYEDGRARPYRARYRDDAGREHRKDFRLKRDAERWFDEVTASLMRGDYVEPTRGKMTVGKWGEKWLTSRVDLKPKTAPWL